MSNYRRQFQDLFDAITFSGTVTLTALAGAETSATVTVPGAAVGDIVLFGVTEDFESANVTASVSAANTVEVILGNATASTITITSAPIKGVVLKPKF